jgi:lipoprotein-releasing system permease protein
MRIRPAFAVAFRFLSGRKQEGRGGGHNYLRGAVAGVALSIVPLVVVLIVADSMIDGITARYLETSTYHLQATPLYWRSAESLKAEAARLEASGEARAKGLLGAYPEIQGPAVAVSAGGTRTEGVLIRALDPRLLSEKGFSGYVEAKSGKLELKSGNEVLLGEALASSLGAKVGDLVTLVSPARASGGELLPKLAAFRVRGIVSSGYRELDALWAIVSLKSGSRLLAPESSRSFIGLKAAAPFKSLESLRSLSLDRLSGGNTDWSVATWGEAEANLWKSFSTTRALLLLIMALTVAVAAVNVGSALVMLVLERRKDLAILKSSGTSSRELGLIFVIAGGFTGISGTLMGLAVGCLLSWRVNDIIAGLEWVATSLSRLLAALSGSPLPQAVKLLNPSYYLEQIPISIAPKELAIIGAASVALCVLASGLAARRAARLSPLELLRKV